MASATRSTSSKRWNRSGAFPKPTGASRSPTTRPTSRTPAATRFAEHVLRQQATAAGTDFTAYVDALLAEAWREPHRWEPDIRLLDRIGPRLRLRQRPLARRTRRAIAHLTEFSKQLRTYADRWKLALEALKAENLEAFADSHPDWAPRLKPDQLKTPRCRRTRHHGTALLVELVPFTRADAARYARLESLKRRADDASAAHYRADVRLGAVLRMRAVLINVAGRPVHGDARHAASARVRKRLAACEDVNWWPSRGRLGRAARRAGSVPPLADEQHLVDAVMPAWMGNQLRAPKGRGAEALQTCNVAR